MIYIFWIILLEAVFPQLPLEYTLISMSDLERFESNSDTGLVSNAIWDIRSSDDELLFFGTGAGLSFADLSSPSNIQYGHFIASELPSGGNPALAIGNGIIAVSGVVDTTVVTGSEQKGTGIAYSRNGGNNWIYLHQSIDSTPHSDSIWHCPYTNSPQSEFYLTEDICSEACYDDNGKSDECHNLYQYFSDLENLKCNEKP